MKRNKPEPDRGDSKDATSAASLLAARSVEARKKQWGKREFVRKMQEWGKLGGRPKGSGKKGAKKGGGK